jgi:hypothetical protein
MTSKHGPRRRSARIWTNAFCLYLDEKPDDIENDSEENQAHNENRNDKAPRKLPKPIWKTNRATETRTIPTKWKRRTIHRMDKRQTGKNKRRTTTTRGGGGGGGANKKGTPKRKP